MATAILAKNCANTYICPGGGTGYGVQFVIQQYDVGTLIIPAPPTGTTNQFKPEQYGLTVTAAATSDFKANLAQTASPLTWWWNNYVINYQGLPGPTPMSCIQPGRTGFAVGLAQTITSTFGISPSRICGAALIRTQAANEIDTSFVKFTFYITDVRPLSTPLRNDYLPSSCLGPWIMTWLAKSTSVTQPNLATIPVPAVLPDNLVSPNCPLLRVGAPSPTLYFTSEINIDKDKLLFIEKLRESFKGSFAKESILSNIIENNENNNIEHATNLTGTSLMLNGAGTNIYAVPQTIFDYYGMYAFPFSFVGAVLFTVVQIMDINLNTLVVNKNLSMAINISFILWSLISLSVFYNFSPNSVPGLGTILSLQVPYILPFNTQAVITQA